MKGILLITALLATQLFSAQCQPPPPPGLYPVYSVDLDNDGYAPFDMDYIITEYHRPMMEEIYTASSSGYITTFYDSNGAVVSGTYTNIVPGEIGNLTYEYSGSGPTFNALPPCFWPGWLNNGIKLNAVPFDGDLDSDGIQNKDEDSNLNINLMDDDSDGDGLVNVLDATENTMIVQELAAQELVVFPNPVRNVLNIASDLPLKSITIYDTLGKMVLEVNSPKAQINIETLSAGIYLLRLDAEGTVQYQKIIVQ